MLFQLCTENNYNKSLLVCKKMSLTHGKMHTFCEGHMQLLLIALWFFFDVSCLLVICFDSHQKQLVTQSVYTVPPLSMECAEAMHHHLTHTEAPWAIQESGKRDQIALAGTGLRASRRSCPLLNSTGG